MRLGIKDRGCECFRDVRLQGMNFLLTMCVRCCYI